MGTIFLPTRHEREFNVFLPFMGLGVGGKGFQDARSTLDGITARWRVIGGVDVDPGVVANASRALGIPGTVMDLFDRDQYIAFHGRQPPDDWREATPADIRRAAGNERPHLVFTSSPCKAASGLLSLQKSQTDKYQALMGLSLRGVWLTLEAWVDDPPEFFLFENVPGIANRGRGFLDQIVAILKSYGYAVAETVHDCGRLGNLAQSRKRFLLVARHMSRVPNSLYQPPARPLRGVGEVIGRLPLPTTSGLHRLPNLHWKTWVRLALVEAGSDWRSLNRLRVEDGMLADYGIVPVREHRRGIYGVNGWTDHAGTLTGNGGRPGCGPFSVADPRPIDASYHHGILGVKGWRHVAPTITGNSGTPTSGAFSVADPRFPWSDDAHGNKLRVGGWGAPSLAVIGTNKGPGSGALAVADPRMPEASGRHSGFYRVVRFDGPAAAVTGASHVAGTAQSVADPRYAAKGDYSQYGVLRFTDTAGAVSGQSKPGGGFFSVADPRPGEEAFAKYAITPWDGSTGTVLAGSTTGQGAYAIADPRPTRWREGRGSYVTGGHYGLIHWRGTAYAVTGSGQYDNSPSSVADPRLPNPNDNLACVIVAEDGTWHRPFTTLEVAALQSIFDPEEHEHFELHGASDMVYREWIGNAVPRRAARAMGEQFLHALLLAETEQTFILTPQNSPVWVRPLLAALQCGTGLVPERG